MNIVGSGQRTLGTRVITADEDTSHALILTPGFSEWTHSLESLGKTFAKQGYDAHLKPPIGQENREQPFYDIETDADHFKSYVQGISDEYDWVGGIGNSFGGITQGVTEAKHPGTFDALVATTTPPTVDTFIPRIGIDAIDHTPDAVLKHGSNLLHHVLNAVNSNYRERTGRLRSYTKQDNEAQFGATRVTNSSDLANRLRNQPRTAQLLKGGDAPVLFAYGGEDTIHTGAANMQHTGHLPQPVTDMVDDLQEDGRDIFSYVLPKADHGFNAETRMDDDFNQDREYRSIRNVMQNFFTSYDGI